MSRLPDVTGPLPRTVGQCLKELDRLERAMVREFHQLGTADNWRRWRERKEAVATHKQKLEARDG